MDFMEVPPAKLRSNDVLETSTLDVPDGNRKVLSTRVAPDGYTVLVQVEGLQYPLAIHRGSTVRAWRIRPDEH